jgi:hypothetical protein
MVWTGPIFCFINYSPSASYEGVWGNGGVCLPILNLVVDGGGEWAASRPGHFTPGEKVAVFLWDSDWEILRYFLDILEGEKNILASARNLIILGTSIS